MKGRVTRCITVLLPGIISFQSWPFPSLRLILQTQAYSSARLSTLTEADRDYVCEWSSLAEAASGWGSLLHLGGVGEEGVSCLLWPIKIIGFFRIFYERMKKRGDFNWKWPVQELRCTDYALSPVFIPHTIHYWAILKSSANGGNFCIK